MALATMCTCGHDYGTHDSTRKGSPCAGTVLVAVPVPPSLGETKRDRVVSLRLSRKLGLPRMPKSMPCKCRRFVASTSTADRSAGDAFIAERARKLAGDPGRTPVHVDAPKGDSLTLFRIMQAIERIAAASEAQLELTRELAARPQFGAQKGGR